MNIRQKSLHLIAIALLAVACLGLHGPASSAEPLLDSYRMDVCSWSRELSRDFLGSTAKGALYEVRMLGGSSTNRDGHYERKTPIRWNGTPNTYYVFCSNALPKATSSRSISCKSDKESSARTFRHSAFIRSSVTTSE
jgi:hypothetical protein